MNQSKLTPPESVSGNRGAAGAGPVHAGDAPAADARLGDPSAQVPAPNWTTATDLPHHPANSHSEPNSVAGQNDPLPGLPSQAQQWRQRRLTRVFWRAVALLFMGLGFMGVVLPVMPHVPFFLVALWAAGKGWPELEQWLLRHPTLGPQLRNWKERGAIARPVKVVTTLMMVCSAIGMQFFGDLPTWLRIAAPCFMLMGAVFMWTRPSD